MKVGQQAKNLALVNAVTFEGFETKADAWAQDGFDMPQEVIDALVPGSVVEVTYSSETGNMWLVMPDAEKGWMRVGQAGTEDPAVCDGSGRRVNDYEIRRTRQGALWRFPAGFTN